MRQFILTLSLVCCFLLVGCGSDSEESQLDSSSGSTVVVGQVYVGGPVEGATIRLEGLDGEALSSSVTNSAGHAYLRVGNLPPEFRAVTRLPGSTHELYSEVRNLDPLDKQVRVSLLTTLVSLYLGRNPGLSLADAEAQVKIAAGLPSGLDISIGPDEPNSLYSDFALLRAASAQGGWASFVEDFLTRTEEGRAEAYRPTLADLTQPITGLDPGLAEVAERARTRLHNQLGLQKLERLPPSLVGMEQEFTTSTAEVLFGIGTGFAGNLASAGTGAVFGWAANQLGLNYGTSGQLAQISLQLSALTMLVESGFRELEDTIFKAEVQATKNFFSDVDTANSSLQTQISDSDPISNTPRNPPDGISGLLTAIQKPMYASVLRNANGSLLGSGGLIMNSQKSVYSGLGLDRPDNMQNSPWRSNQVLDQFLSIPRTFFQQQVITLNLVAESAHFSLQFPNPVTGVEQNIPVFRMGVANVKSQLQQLTFPQSNRNIIIDYENGIMWWGYMFDPVTYDQAVATASSHSVQAFFPDGTSKTYQDWRLPTFGEYRSLQNRGKYNQMAGDPNFDGQDDSHTVGGVPVNSKESYPDTGQATAGLPRLGFANVAEALKAAPNDNGRNGDMWMSLYTGLDSPDPRFEFRLNHGINHVSKNNRGSDKNVFLLCRTFGPDVLTSPFAGTMDGPIPSAVRGQPFENGEYCQYGVPVSLSLDSEPAPGTVSYPDPDNPGESKDYTVPQGSVQMIAQVSYTINLGGNFVMGTGTHLESFSNSFKSHTSAVSTRDQNTGSPNLLRQLVNWSSADPKKLELLNVPFVGGIGIPLSTDQVTLTAELLGGGGEAVSGTLDLTPEAISPHRLTSISISPRNQIYGVNGRPSVSASYQYFLTAFFADGTIEPKALEAVWSVDTVPAGDEFFGMNEANAQILNDGSGIFLEMNQPPQNPVKPYELLITATFTDPSDPSNIQTDSTRFRIVAPLP